MRRAYDYLVIGGGIIGLNIARVLKARFPDVRIGLMEKERTIGFHASGRNSGVLHAGFYYSAESFKAKFTKQGNAAMTEYCETHKLPINKCGKVVVATNDDEIKGLEELKRRGDTNKIDLAWIDEGEAREIDPNIRFYKKALYSRTTSTIDPLLICQHMAKGLQASGVDLLYGQQYVGRLSKSEGIMTNLGPVPAHIVINAAGLYADKVAQDYGFGKQYALLPFKGLYLKSHEKATNVRTNIYPVPNIKQPFLGVHFTLTVDGHAKIGPTAMPAFWRENYTWHSRFNAKEMLQALLYDTKLFLKNDFNFRGLAIEELRKSWRRYMLRKASVMVKELNPAQFDHWGQPGIRAQLVDTQKCQLVPDFIVEGDARSWHVLNAVSPAFTCSIPLSQWLVSKFAP
jgi:L-2-hydroxyglutarate oxidase